MLLFCLPNMCCVVVCGCVSVISVTNPVRLRSRMCQKEVFLLWNLQGGSNYTSAEEIRSEYLLRFLDTNKHIGFTGLEFGDKKKLLGLRQMEKTLWGAPMLRHGKSRKHASNACGQFLRKLWTFLFKPQFFFAIFTHQCSQVCIIIHNDSICFFRKCLI